MKLLFFLPFIQAEIICDYDEPCLKTCTDSVCEYFWNIEHRFTRTWRTQDYGKGRSYSYGALRDVPIEWNTTTARFDIVQEGINSGVHHIYDENGNERNPLDELEKLFLVDGQPQRKVITINGQIPGPKIIVKKGALVKVHVKSTLHEESCKLKQQNHSLFFKSYDSLARTAPSRQLLERRRCDVQPVPGRLV